MGKITRHSKIRILERNDEIQSISDAKKMAKQAKAHGKVINCFQKYPRFFSYLQNKRSQTNDCSIRVYQGCIYIWRGKTKSLVTAHKIPERYLREMEEIDNKEKQ